MSHHQYSSPIARNGSNRSAPTRNVPPGCPHVYPVAVTRTGLGSGLQLAQKTLPYAWFRYVEGLFLSAITFAVLTVVIGVTVVLYVYVHEYAGGAAFIAGMLALIFLVLPFIDQQTFLSHCGHIAVLTNSITHGDVGNGQQRMFKFGRDTASRSLGELDTIREVHGAIRAATRNLLRTLNVLDAWLPIDLGVVKRLVHRVVNWATPYVDAVVLSYGIARGDRDFAKAGLDGLCYSLQNATSVLKTAIGAFVVEKLILTPLWLAIAVGAGVATLVSVLQFGGAGTAPLLDNPRAFFQQQPLLGLGAVAAGLTIGALVAHLVVKTVSDAFVRPMLTAMVLVKFHVTVQGQALDAELQSRIIDANDGLSNLSDFASRATRLAL
jgi:hypothetical protein